MNASVQVWYNGLASFSFGEVAVFFFTIHILHPSKNKRKSLQSCKIFRKEPGFIIRLSKKGTERKET